MALFAIIAPPLASSFAISASSSSSSALSTINSNAIGAQKGHEKEHEKVKEEDEEPSSESHMANATRGDESAHAAAWELVRNICLLLVFLRLATHFL